MSKRKYVLAVLVSVVSIMVFYSSTFAETKRCSGTIRFGLIQVKGQLFTGEVIGHNFSIFERNDKVFSTCDEYNDIRMLVQEVTDYVGGSGKHWGYFTMFMKNGDEEYGSFSGTTVYREGVSTWKGESQMTGGTGASANKKWRGTYQGKWDAAEGVSHEWEIVIEE